MSLNGDVIKAISTIGVPAAIAFFVLAMLAGLIPSPLLKMQVSIGEHERVALVAQQQAERTSNEMLGILRSYTELHLKLLRQVCRNQAKSEVAALECDR